MGSGGGANQAAVTKDTSTMRYAPYVEAAHKSFLATVKVERQRLEDVSIYKNYMDIDADVGFLGAGYTLASYPALYDMFGKYMAGLDIETLWNELIEDETTNETQKEFVQSEGRRLADRLKSVEKPELKIAARNAGIVHSSTFINEMAILESDKLQALSDFDARLKSNAMERAQGRWQTEINWNTGIVAMYADIVKSYLTTKVDVDDFNFAIHRKDLFWPFTILEYERAALGVLTGAKNVSSTSKGGGGKGNKVMGVLGGAVSGAAIGGAIGNLHGAIIGGVLGGVAGLFGS
jgi:hypothetical protein